MSNKEPLSCFDIVRYTFSIALSLAMMAVIVIGIGGGHAVMPGHPAILFGILMFCIVLLAYLEGLQVAILAIEGLSSEGFAKEYPRAAALQDAVNEGKNVRRFLIGRQFFVIFVVYLTAQVTTFPSLPRMGMPDVVFLLLIQTGLPGALTVLAFGQLLAQLIAATHPVHVLNLPGAHWVLNLTLGLEYMGITHFSWFITITAKKCCGLDKHHQFAVNNLKIDDNGGASGWLLNPRQENLVIKVENEAEIYHKHEDLPEYPPTGDTTQSEVVIDMSSEESHGGNKWPATPQPDKFPTPHEVVRSLLAEQMPVPRFLLPPYHESHIPPHVVACSLLYRGHWNDNNATDLPSFLPKPGSDPSEWSGSDDGDKKKKDDSPNYVAAKDGDSPYLAETTPPLQSSEKQI